MAEFPRTPMVPLSTVQKSFPPVRNAKPRRFDETLVVERFRLIRPVDQDVSIFVLQDDDDTGANGATVVATLTTGTIEEISDSDDDATGASKVPPVDNSDESVSYSDISADSDDDATGAANVPPVDGYPMIDTIPITGFSTQFPTQSSETMAAVDTADVTMSDVINNAGHATGSLPQSIDTANTNDTTTAGATTEENGSNDNRKRPEAFADSAQRAPK